MSTPRVLYIDDDPGLGLTINAQAAVEEDEIRQANQTVANEEGEIDDLAWLDALTLDHLHGSYERVLRRHAARASDAVDSTNQLAENGRKTA